jgi:thiosulfate/3-mercaptopyruvate sulfurtransferase
LRRFDIDAIANPDGLMSAGFLAAHPYETSIRVIDVDEDTTAYDKGHIRGSVGWSDACHRRAS